MSNETSIGLTDPSNGHLANNPLSFNTCLYKFLNF